MKNSFLTRLRNPLLIAAAVIGTALTSCNDNSEIETDQLIYNIVTVKTAGTSGMTFTFRTGETTPLLTLTSTMAYNQAFGFKEGQRVLIGYTIPTGSSAEESGPIDILNYRLVYNDTIRTATPNIVSSYLAAEMSNAQIWRTGNYLNAYAEIPVTTPAVNLCLYADPESIKDGEVDMYLTLDNRNVSPSQRAGCYASYPITSFLNKHPDVHTFKVHVAGAFNQSKVDFNNVYFLPGE